MGFSSQVKKPEKSEQVRQRLALVSDREGPSGWRHFHLVNRQPHRVANRRVQVLGRDDVFYRFLSHLIGCSILLTALNATIREQAGIATEIVPASTLPIELGISSEFRRHGHSSRVEQPS